MERFESMKRSYGDRQSSDRGRHMYTEEKENRSEAMKTCLKPMTCRVVNTDESLAVIVCPYSENLDKSAKINKDEDLLNLPRIRAKMAVRNVIVFATCDVISHQWLGVVQF